MRQDIGGEGDDGYAGDRPTQRTDAARRLQAVHAGHVDVHQNQIEGFDAHHRNRRGAILAGRCFRAQGLQNLLSHQAVGGVVVDNQHSQASESGLRRSRCRSALWRINFWRDKLQPEGGALVHPAIDPDVATHHFGYAFAVWKLCRVAPDYHVEIDGNWYSVPYRLIGERPYPEHGFRTCAGILGVPQGLLHGRR